MLVFDSIAHPTLNATWFNKKADNTFESLVAEYQKHSILGGCAVSLPIISIDELEQYYKKCRQYGSFFYPVAAFNFDEADDEKKIISIREIGYKAIKIHIRLSEIDIDNDFERLQKIFLLCEKHGLIIFFCTYYHTTINFTPLFPITYYLIRLLKAAPLVKIILLHGGDVNLMNIAQLARFNANILIDFSYTFIKFAGSSIEKDILFLMNNFDKKICFGSDYPEYSISLFKEQLEKLAESVTDENKYINFGYKNITDFLQIN